MEGSGSGDDFRQVTDARLQAMLANAVGKMDDAGRAGRGDDVGTGCLVVGDLAIQHLPVQIVLGEGVGSGAAAAPVRFGQFDKVNSGDFFEEHPGLSYDALPPGGVARIVICDLDRGVDRGVPQRD